MELCSSERYPASSERAVALLRDKRGSPRDWK